MVYFLKIQMKYYKKSSWRIVSIKKRKTKILMKEKLINCPNGRVWTCISTSHYTEKGKHIATYVHHH